MKPLVFCADDFAQSVGISEAILRLIGRGRLSATSVMSQSPLWPQLAPALLAEQEHIDMGLHLNLTHPFTAASRSLGHWLLCSQLRCLSQRRLRDRFVEQIDRFAEVSGRLPDFLDGHQHVHAFGQIRQALFAAIAARWPEGQRPYVRAPERLIDSGDAYGKAQILKLACRGFAEKAAEHGLCTPSAFAGLYSLTPTANLPGLMRRWLRDSPAYGLIMCHPGMGEEGDEIGPARQAEYRFLNSDRFLDYCGRCNVRISRFSPV